MCLTKLDAKIRFSKEEEKVAYKAFRIRAEGLNSIHQGPNKFENCLPLDQWVKSTVGWIKKIYGTGQQYRKGFHASATKAGALRWGSVVLKVKIRKIQTVGYQSNFFGEIRPYKTYVAREMFISSKEFARVLDERKARLYE